MNVCKFGGPSPVNKFRLAVSLGVLILLYVPSIASDEVYYRLSGERLGCLVEHASSYLENNKNMLIIAVDICPEKSDDPILLATKMAVTPTFSNSPRTRRRKN